jgi:H+-translocating NAD(P) transhydrogenase subunit beta
MTLADLMRRRTRQVLLGAAGAVLAVVTVFAAEPLGNVPLITLAMAGGAVIGAPTARRVPMTAMPQLVAIFNGVGGGAAALVALVEFLRTGAVDPVLVTLATVFSALVGCMSLTGNVVTFAKLQELMTARPVVFRGSREVSVALAVAILSLGAAVAPTRSTGLLVVVAVAAMVSGVLFVLPVGRGGRAGRHLAAERVHRPRRARLTRQAEQRPRGNRG